MPGSTNKLAAAMTARGTSPDAVSGLLGSLQSLGVNGNSSFGVYMPSGMNVAVVPSASIGGNSGQVGMLDSNTAKVAGDVGDDEMSRLETLFHEASHTTQPLLNVLAQRLGLGAYGRLSNNEFDGYANGVSKPPPSEALATLRAQEALLPTGKTIFDTQDGQDYIAQTVKNNPAMTPAGARRFIELQMFPEHQMLSDGSDFRQR